MPVFAQGNPSVPSEPWSSNQWPATEQVLAGDGSGEYVDEEALLFAPREATSLPAGQRNRRTGGEDRAPLKIGAMWTAAQNVRGQNSQLSFTSLRANLAAPLFIDPAGQEIWLAMFGLEHLELGGSAILPDSLIPLPDELWQISLGTMHRLELDNGWQVGSLFTIGTASDAPFGSWRDMTLTAIGFLEVPAGERDAWSFSLFYSTTSQLPFPLPGIAYVWRPSENFTANIGVPFSLWYQPTETLTFTASYRPLTNFSVRATQNLAPYWNLYSTYQIVNETYWLDERQVTKERLYLFDQRVAVGLERELPFGFSLDLSAAYLFDRRLFQAESFSDDRRDVLNIEPGPAVSLFLRWNR